MGKKTAAAFRIDQRNTVAESTRPELAFDGIFEKRVDKPNPVQIVDDEGSKWSISPDRTFVGTNVLVQVDGVYHRTRRQERKTKWEDMALNEKGFRVLHIDAELLMAQKWHPYVTQRVEAFLKGLNPTERIAA